MSGGQGKDRARNNKESKDIEFKSDFPFEDHAVDTGSNIFNSDDNTISYENTWKEDSFSADFDLPTNGRSNDMSDRKYGLPDDSPPHKNDDISGLDFKGAPDTIQDTEQSIARPQEKLLRSIGTMACVGQLFSGYMIGLNLGIPVGATRVIFEGIMTKSLPSFGGIISSALHVGATYGGYIGIYRGCSCQLRVLRKKDDYFNSFCGGFMGGFLMTLFTRRPYTAGPRLPAAVASGVGLGAFVTAFQLFIGRPL